MKFLNHLLISFSRTYLLIVVLCIFLTTCIVYADSNDPFYPPLYPNNYPLPASFTAIGSSTSFTSSPSSSASQEPIVLTETRASVQRNQSAVQMITFKNEGTLKAVCLTGNGFELYSLMSDKFPNNSTLRSDYGKSSMVTTSSPVSLDISAGIWFFTIFPIGDGCSYDITATLKGSSITGSSGSSSFSSSMGVRSISFS